MTDLDGTLLDDDYPYDAAAKALDTLAHSHRGVRVALASSKTAEEMVSIAARCEVPPLLVFENGAGIAWDGRAQARQGRLRRGTYEIAWYGPDYRHIRRALGALREKRGYRFEGFGDMSDVAVARRTGLDAGAARTARRRLASEPIVWHDGVGRFERFRSDLERQGLTVQAGGRFQHVTANACKARALKDLQRTSPPPRSEHIMTIACGDAPNDREMLQAADFAIVFPDASGGYLLPASPRVIHAPAAGPQAWLAEVTRVFNRHT